MHYFGSSRIRICIMIRIQIAKKSIEITWIYFYWSGFKWSSTSDLVAHFFEFTYFFLEESFFLLSGSGCLYYSLQASLTIYLECVNVLWRLEADHSVLHCLVEGCTAVLQEYWMSKRAVLPVFVHIYNKMVAMRRRGNCWENLFFSFSLLHPPCFKMTNRSPQNQNE